MVKQSSRLVDFLYFLRGIFLLTPPPTPMYMYESREVTLMSVPHPMRSGGVPFFKKFILGLS